MSYSTSINENELMKKLRWKIIPFIFVLFIIAYIDRVNLGYAALRMNAALSLSATAFGTVSGIFFVAYFFFEIPSNILLHKLGARLWIGRILISWGLVVIGTAFVENLTHLMILRVLLGIAEAGFFPGIILYLTYWFPAKHQARAIAAFYTALAVANIVGGPISTAIMQYIDWFGIPGWRWLFILEGLPAVVFGFLTFKVLIDRPEKADFLTKDEKEWLLAELKKEHEAKLEVKSISRWETLKSPRVWYLALIYFLAVTALYGVGFWMPTIVKGLSAMYSDAQVGFITAIPNICGAIAMVVIARHSDKTMERRYHVGLPMLLGAIGLISLSMVTDPLISVALLCVTVFGMFGFFGSFWTIPSMFLTGESAAVGLALINSVGNLGGFLGPYSIGFLKDLTKTMTSGLWFMGFCSVMVTILILLIPQKNITAIFDATKKSAK